MTKARIVLSCNDCGAAANVGGDVSRWVKTFVVELPDEVMEALKPRNYYHANVVGIELVEDKTP